MLSQKLLFITLLLSGISASVGRAGRFDVSSPQQEAFLVSRIQASHFLTHATFGPRVAEIDQLARSIRKLGYKPALESWIDQQFDIPPTQQTKMVVDVLHDNGYPNFENSDDVNVNNRFRSDALWTAMIAGRDQLRQRTAWALSQIFVVNDFNGFNSTKMEVTNLPRYAGYSTYYDIFVNNAFTNYRNVLGEVTYHPIMGFYLTHLNNRRAVPEQGIFPDENYARECMQLFTIGLHKVKDHSGVLAVDGNGDLIPTYDNDDIATMARVFTGFVFNGERSETTYTRAMKMNRAYHDRDPKRLLDGTTLPQRRANDAPELDVDAALDMLFNQPETPPFVARLLIQRFTHSNPSPGYVANVARWFHGGRRGQRGDMKAILKAILLQNEAAGLRIKRIRDERQNVIAVEATGRRNAQSALREPMVRWTAFIRAFEGKTTMPGGRFHLGDTREYLNQSPFKSPSVFNFYLPDFQPAGPLSETELVAPEFQILTSVSANEMFNAFRSAVNVQAIRLGNVAGKSADIKLDFTPYYRLARTSASNLQSFHSSLRNLLEELDILLCQGTLSEETKQIILNVVRDEQLTSERSREDTVRLIILLILTCPDCAVAD